MRALFVCRSDMMAAGALKGWLEAGHEAVEIWHGPQRSLRRTQRTLGRFAPDWSVYRVATLHGIPMFSNPLLRRWPEATQRIEELRADVLITCVTMQIVPPVILEMFGRRAVNFHPALLPHYRGPAPLTGQLVDGRENECGGLTLHQLTAGIDEGPIIAQIPISYDSVGRSYEAWRVACAFAARELARKALPAFLENRLVSTVQGAGSYRRLDESPLGTRSTLDDVRRVMDRVGQTGRVMAAGRPVRKLKGTLGPPTGKPAHVGLFSVTLDIADARIRLTRWNGLDDLRVRLEQLAAIRQRERRAHE